MLIVLFLICFMHCFKQVLDVLKGKSRNFYAQQLILVNLILINFGGFLVVARNAENGI